MKRYKRIFLVSHLYPSKDNICIYPSAGIAYLAQSLEDAAYEYYVMEMGIGYCDKYLIKKILEFKPDLIAVSMRTMNYKKQYKLFDKLKALKRGFDIIVGGPHTAYMADNILGTCKSIDYFLQGEGEAAIIELCSGQDLEAIRGLAWMENDRVIRNQPRDYENNLDKIAYPRYNKFELNKYPSKYISVISSRGCPYRCVFCGDVLMHGNSWRTRSVDSVMEEIGYLYSAGCRHIDFGDSNFSYKPQRIEELCSRIIEKNFDGMEFSVMNGIRADKASPELLAKMYQAGFRLIAIGVESFNDRVLKVIKKGEICSDIDKAVKTATELGFSVHLFIQIGNQSETFKEALNSIGFALKYPVSRVRFYNSIPQPDTEYFEYANKLSLLMKDPEDYMDKAYNTHGNKPVVSTEELSYLQRKLLLSIAGIAGFYIRLIHYSRLLKKKYGLLFACTAGLFLIPPYTVYAINYCLLRMIYIRLKCRIRYVL